MGVRPLRSATVRPWPGPAANPFPAEGARIPRRGCEQARPALAYMRRRRLPDGRSRHRRPDDRTGR